ncbi:hypothetical protein CS0771_38360 [Catellatospora sp. IY07-71]|uniref:hypothetical protein n=1 Tax=Catellatospora sp. IY07-71 TaxID=2728827 RepID=UPI001BB65547|nr:hypothetical protein [Catellatospora sp. IY07-71]BCJ74292.1 hypothetical protein CS0771_38360 [Catellatospora sp. IY07-71]
MTLPGGDTVALRIDHAGGFVPPAFNLTRLPEISVYADGRVITQGPVTMIYPPAALPNLQVQRISTGDVQKLVQLAVAAGVGKQGVDYGTPQVADLPNARFTVTTADGVQRTEVYALMDNMEPAAGLTPAQIDARKKLLDLMKAVTDLPTTLGAKAVSASEPYKPVKVAAIATPWQAPGDGTSAGPEIAWPGPALPGASQGEGLNLGCVVAEGKDADAVMSAAAQATSLTPWTSGGKSWTVSIRPLLPDETGCESLGK